MGEHRQPIFGDVFVKPDASLSIAQQTRQRSLAVEKRATTQILAIMLNQVEGIEDRGSTTASPSIVRLLALMSSRRF